MKRRPVTVQYPYEKLILRALSRADSHEFDKCIACEVCVRVCPINLPVVDWVMNKETKKKELRNYSIDSSIFVEIAEYCLTNCLSMMRASWLPSIVTASTSTTALGGSPRV